MDPPVRNPGSTTFFGRRFTRREISDIRETVALLPGNSRNELARTICEHPDWYNSRGAYRRCRPQGIGTARGVWHPATSAQAHHHRRQEVTHRPYPGF